MSNKCKTEGCDNQAKYSTGICHACYQYLYYWQRKGLTKALKHQGKLVLRQRRMQMLMPSNVRLMKRAGGR